MPKLTVFEVVSVVTLAVGVSGFGLCMAGALGLLPVSRHEADVRVAKAGIVVTVLGIVAMMVLGWVV